MWCRWDITQIPTQHSLAAMEDFRVSGVCCGLFLEALLTCSSSGIVQLGTLQYLLPKDPSTWLNTCECKHLKIRKKMHHRSKGESLCNNMLVCACGERKKCFNVTGERIHRYEWIHHESTKRPERWEAGHRYSEEVWGESKKEIKAQCLHSGSSETCQEFIYTTSKGVPKGSGEFPPCQECLWCESRQQHGLQQMTWADQNHKITFVEEGDF